jgi:transposase, IS30 family
MDYTHLTRDERYQIQALKKAGHAQRAIATLIQRHPSTISRELVRNSTPTQGYRGDLAHSVAMRRAQGCANAPQIAASAWDFAQARLLEQWSPEEISGHLRAQGLPGASHEILYRRIYADKRRGGCLWRQLRCQRPQRKRYGQYDRRGRTRPSPATSIEHRPAIVETRTTLGHWEGDTMIDSHLYGALVSLVERKSRYTLLAKVKRRKADLVCAAITGLLEPFKLLAQTLTLDNGKEFYAHQRIVDALQIQCYFAKPYASWQRGTNENTNGLIRQYFPRKRRIKSIRQSEIQLVMDRLNHRPRKCLGFKTPHEVFMAAFQNVALQD